MKNINFRLRIPASTSNIGPGFDTLGLALKIYNSIEISEINNSNKFNIEYLFPHREINEDNDIYLKSYRIATRALGEKIKGFSAKIRNRIPIGAGLGSSGSAVIGGVITAFLIAGEKIDLHKVLNIAITIEHHPDNITPCLVGGFTVSGVVNGEVHFQKFIVKKRVKVVVVLPDFTLETKKAREVLPSRLSLEDVVANLNRASYLVSSFAKNDFENIQWAFHDRLHQPTRSKLIPGLNDVIESANRRGAYGCFLSGAGPSVVALCSKNEEKIGKTICNVWKKHGVNAKSFVTEIDNDGTKILECNS